MFNVPEEDRKVFLEYLSRRPYIEVAALIARIAAWKKEDKEVETDKTTKTKKTLVLGWHRMATQLFQNGPK